MLNFERSCDLRFLIVMLAGLILAPGAYADDKDDVLAFIHQYGELEGDLKAQAKLIRDDRVMITSVRQSDAAKNMAIQMAARQASEAINGGKTKFITTIESPQIAIYGNVAVTSFERSFAIFPHNQPAEPPGPSTWVTLVLVKERGEWGIAHTHISPVGGD